MNVDVYLYDVGTNGESFHARIRPTSDSTSAREENVVDVDHGDDDQHDADDHDHVVDPDVDPDDVDLDDDLDVHLYYPCAPLLH